MAKTSGSGGTIMPMDEQVYEEVDRYSEAYWKGYSAGFIADPHECPYLAGSSQAKEWEEGYAEGNRES
jgi:ribosome modulation factor